MKKQECEHKRTRKLFYHDGVKQKWVRTGKILCLDCHKQVELKEVKEDDN